MNVRSSYLLAFLPLLVTACGAQVLDVGSNANDKAPNDATPTDPNDPSNPSGSSSVFPTSACVALGPTAKVVYTPDPTVSVQVLIPQDDTLWVSAYTSPTSGTNVVGQAVSVPLHAGAPQPLVLDSLRNLAGIFSGQLVYVRTTHQGSGTAADPAVEEVVVRDSASGALQVLPNPAGLTYVSDVNVHASGIYVENRAWDATTLSPISRWTSGNAEAQLTALGNYTSLVTDGKDVFYVRWVEDGSGSVTEIHIEAVSVTGGTPRVLRTYPYDNKFFYAVTVIDDDEVYFTQEATDSGGTIGAGDLRAMKKDGSSERVVASAQKFGTASFHIDPDYVTWNDQDAQQTMVRVHRAGGALERIEGEASRWVSTIAVDSCNLYWAVENPTAVYGRSRLP